MSVQEYQTKIYDLEDKIKALNLENIHLHRHISYLQHELDEGEYSYEDGGCGDGSEYIDKA